jgi:hypothetical protein
MENSNEAQQPTSNTEHTNVELIYNYTESLLKARNDTITQLNGKLSTFLGFGGLLLRFSADLPQHSTPIDIPGFPCSTCLLLKIVACALSAASVCLSALGLTAQERGSVVSPDKLMAAWFRKPDVRCRSFIINTWRGTIEEFRLLGIKKARRLNLAIYLLAIAAIVFALDIGIASYFCSAAKVLCPEICIIPV